MPPVHSEMTFVLGWNNLVVKRTLGGLNGSTPQVSHAHKRAGGWEGGGRTVGGEPHFKGEDVAVAGAALRTHDRGPEFEQIVALWPHAEVGGGVALQVLKLAFDAFLSHLQNFMPTLLQRGFH